MTARLVHPRCIALIAAIAATLGVCGRTARAVDIVANGSRVFYDSFENDVINGEPTTPTYGTWEGTSTYSHVLNTSPPGAYEGSQYLRLIRPGGVTVGANFGLV